MIHKLLSTSHPSAFDLLFTFVSILLYFFCDLFLGFRILPRGCLHRVAGFLKATTVKTALTQINTVALLLFCL